MSVTRFAPSPNGSLHLGHAYSAIVAHDLAAASGDPFLLRIEDIDGPRSRPELAAEFREDLAWLGLEWREVAPQSERLPSYEAAADRLKALGLLYPCGCTRAQIVASAVHSGSEGPLYPGTCRGKTGIAEEGAAWRLDTAKALALTGSLSWEDALTGGQQADPMRFGDPVLLRKDAPASYHLAATLDDAADGVTLVTRGQDLFEASHLHRLLQALLGLPVPRWHHHPLLVDASGAKLAKRKGSPSLAARRLAGEDGIAIAAALRDGTLPAGIFLSDSLSHQP